MIGLESNYTVRGRDGNPVSIQLNAQEYEVASQKGLTLSQYLTRKYGSQVDEARDGSVVGQMMANSGMFLASDDKTGHRAPTMQEIVTDGIQVNDFTRNTGEDRHTPSGRILFPEVVMRTLEDRLRRSDDLLVKTWESMVATTQSVAGPIFDQPQINVTEPEQSEHSPIAQLSEPDAMISITTSEYTKRIPTKSIGLVISDQAMMASTLDLVNLALNAQARGEQVRMIEGHMRNIFNGDVDLDEDPVGNASQAKDWDDNITEAGQISHKAYVKWLWSRHQYRTLSHVCCDIDTAFALDTRTGMPTRDTVYAEGSLFPGQPVQSMINVPNPIILPISQDIIGSDTIVGLDKRYAIRRVINVQAQYSSMEKWLLRRASAFRLDFGEIAHKLYNDAFDKLTLTVE